MSSRAGDPQDGAAHARQGRRASSRASSASLIVTSPKWRSGETSGAVVVRSGGRDEIERLGRAAVLLAHRRVVIGVLHLEPDHASGAQPLEVAALEPVHPG